MFLSVVWPIFWATGPPMINSSPLHPWTPVELAWTQMLKAVQQLQLDCGPGKNDAF